MSGAAGPSELPGQTIGRYKLLELLGEGGMGSVWLAEQREPVRRRVALKIIKLGMDTKQVIARFEAERQALALMDHPHIAKVLDAGATETGRPYFVMESIRGVPIVEYCDRERLDTTARLRLFVGVCHAIQHAHQKGIIHRDIKPSNVLVTMHDGVPVPKVIDFGIAKATTGELTTKTLFTEHRQLIGTPAYMSPEQAEMSGLDIDTRSDVYSLGVLLYELLTGTTPFDTRALLAQGFAEMMRIIREDEPHRPSTRVSTLGATGTRTAAQRQSDVKALGLKLRGDLDWIAMKCLEKDRTRRYETANGLARDVERHLVDEPVSAGPPTARYRLGKFVKRNRMQVVAGGVVAAALVLGFGGTALGLWKALREKERADEAAERARASATAETAARIEAQANAAHAIAEAERASEAAAAEAISRKRVEAGSEFMIAALDSGDAFNEGGGEATTVLEAMDDAIRDLDAGRFAQDPESEMTLRSMIGVVLQNNGRLARGEQQAARVLELAERVHAGDHESVADALANLAQVRSVLGRSAEAEPMARRALAMSERLHGPDDLRVASALNTLAVVLDDLGRSEEAEALSARSVELHRRHHAGDHTDLAQVISVLAMQRHALGRLEEAERGYLEALGMLQRLHDRDHPQLAMGMNNVAVIQRDLGRFEDAEALIRRTVEMYRRLYAGDHPELVTGLNNLSFVLQQLGRWEEGDACAVQALEMSRRLYPGDHQATAILLECLSDARDGLGRHAEAEALQRESTAMHERIHVPDHPDILRSRGLLALHYWTRKQFDRSLPLFEAVVRDQERTLGPEHPDTLVNVGNLGTNLLDLGRPEEALPLLERAYREFGATEPSYADRLIEEYRRRAAAGEAGFREKAVAMVRDFVEAARAANARGSPELAIKLAEHGKAMLNLGAWAEAEALLRECLAIREAVAPDTWGVFNARSILGGALLGRGELAQAEPLLLEGCRGMLEREATIPEVGKPRVGEAIDRLVRLYEELGRPAEAAEWRTLREARAR